MDERHRCKLCFRNFASGKALGGHMRSHMMKLSAENRASSKREEGEGDRPSYDFQSVHSYSSTSAPLSSEEEEEEDEEAKALWSCRESRENSRKSTPLADHELSFAAGSDVLQDRESETESSKRNPVCRRSKRVRKSRISDFKRFGINGFFQVKKPKLEREVKSNANEQSSPVETEPLSSISDTTPEEHVAHCLIMLSRDKWRREEEVEHPDEDEQEEEETEKSGDDYSEDSGVLKVVSATKVRGKYRCETCNKLFRSYQALGGHRASHNKTKVNAAEPPEKMGGGSTSRSSPAVEEKTHECPYCHRIFSSGQALGGHKRSHFVGGGAVPVPASVGPVRQTSRAGDTLNIDLNLPAPNDDDETSQIAVSAVSDADFVHPIKQ